MENKRSKGVSFWAWVFIVSAIMGLLLAINPKQKMQFYAIGMLVFSVISSLAYLICGIFILKLNNSARKAVIILGYISIIAIPFYLKPVLTQMNSNDYYSKNKQMIINQMKPEFQQKALENLEKEREIGKKVLPTFFIIILGLPWLIFELAPIYFFTRPKVKEQFQIQQ